MRLKKCPIDIKLALFCIFSVGLVTIDLGSDSAQGNSYIEEGNYYWGYSTISLIVQKGMVFGPFCREICDLASKFFEDLSELGSIF